MVCNDCNVNNIPNIDNQFYYNYLLFYLYTDDINTNIEHLETNVCTSLSPITSCVRCSVHTLQLCILQGFKSVPIMNTVSRARHVNNNIE